MAVNITELLAAWRRGSAEAGEAVIAQTYQELRFVAHRHIRREKPGHTLQTTALLHEAYLRLLRHGPGTAENREAFFRLMAAEMRRRLVDHARRRLTHKRGAGVVHQSLDESAMAVMSHMPNDVEKTLVRLDQALTELTNSFPRSAQVVQLRFFAGLTTDETASELGLSSGTVKREWTFARAWLLAAMKSEARDKA